MTKKQMLEEMYDDYKFERMAYDYADANGYDTEAKEHWYASFVLESLAARMFNLSTNAFFDRYVDEKYATIA